MLSWAAAYTGFSNLETDGIKMSAVAAYLGVRHISCGKITQKQLMLYWVFSLKFTLSGN